MTVLLQLSPQVDVGEGLKGRLLLWIQLWLWLLLVLRLLQRLFLQRLWIHLSFAALLT
jgi:hypothetical protein